MSVFTRTALAAALLAAAPLASAATDTATDTFTVSLTLENSCTVEIGDLTFPTSSSLENAILGSTTGAVKCTGIGFYTVSFDDGVGSGATSAARKMTFGTNTIDYILSKNADGSELLGDDAGTATFTGTSVGNDVADPSFTIYGRVAASQNPKPTGTYTDTVTATVAF